MAQERSEVYTKHKELRAEGYYNQPKEDQRAQDRATNRAFYKANPDLPRPPRRRRGARGGGGGGAR